MKDLVLPSATIKGKWLDTRVAKRVCTPKFLGEIEGGEGFLGYFCCQKCLDETNLYSLVKVLGYFMEWKISSALDLYKTIYVPTYCNLDETNLYSLVKVLGYFMEWKIPTALDIYKTIYVPTYCNLDETKSLILNLQWSDNVTRKLARN